ncbi:MAG TPA: formylglycine-generating enzyme family protein [Chitinophagales bacterium]|nr:formylglycine-generating enzyme family protein [Chitinophagales bacterium]
MPALFPSILLYVGSLLTACESHTASSKEAGLQNPQTAVLEQPVQQDSIASPAGGPQGMVWIAGGDFTMGIDNDPESRPDESPAHKVHVDGYWMDITEVTNAQFAAFVKATGYITTAEIKPDWEELKKQLPPDTPKPPDSIFVPGSLVFDPPNYPVSLDNIGQWWAWVHGASWKQPLGPGSSITGKENYPAVQVSWDDAVAYCKWAGKRLPTEAEWEFASRGGYSDKKYPWGNDQEYAKHANTWNGHFPDKNTKEDGYELLAPVKSYPPNGFGLYDMAGNVWEWCSDWYRFDYYKECKEKSIVSNPTGPSNSYDPEEPTVPKRVNRGGSFLCNDSYCSSYRVAARMKTSPDTGLEHCGFRCVMTNEQWEALKKKNGSK